PIVSSANPAKLNGMADGTAPASWLARRFDFTGRIQLWGIGFVLPTVIFFAVFKYGPMLWALELSFTSYDMVSKPDFVGLENYHNLAVDPIFRETLINTLVYIGGSTVLITVVGLALALAINTRVPGARTCMTAMFLTNLMPIIAVCLVWRFLLHPHGLDSQLLRPFSIGRIDWLTTSTTALPATTLVTVRRFAPYFIMIFLAALLAIPAVIY